MFIKWIFFGIAIFLFFLSLIQTVRVIDRTRAKFFKFIIWLGAFVLYIVWFFGEKKVGSPYLNLYTLTILAFLVFLLTRHSFAWAYILKRNCQFNKMLNIETIPQIRSEETIDEIVNAFAFCEGEKNIIALTPAAVTRISKSEQNFLLAHEIAHHYLGHTSGENTVSQILETIVGVGGAILSIFTGGLTGLVSYGIGYGIIKKIVNKYHSRENEREADKLAISFLKKAGLDPNGAIKLFETLSSLCEQYKWYEKFYLKIFGTHPLDEDRIKYIGKLIKENE